MKSIYDEKRHFLGTATMPHEIGRYIFSNDLKERVETGRGLVGWFSGDRRVVRGDGCGTLLLEPSSAGFFAGPRRRSVCRGINTLAGMNLQQFELSPTSATYRNTLRLRDPVNESGGRGAAKRAGDPLYGLTGWYGLPPIRNPRGRESARAASPRVARSSA
jgi:hypothetical protein